MTGANHAAILLGVVLALLLVYVFVWLWQTRPTPARRQMEAERDARIAARHSAVLDDDDYEFRWTA